MFCFFLFYSVHVLPLVTSTKSFAFMNYGLIVYDDSKCIYIRYINTGKWKKTMPKIIFYPNTTPTLSTQRAAWTLLPHDFTSSLTLSLTLSREQLLKLSVSCFFPPRCRACGWSCHQFSPRPCFNTSPGITAAWADIYIYSFYTFFFFLFKLASWQVDLSRGSPRCLTASWAAFKRC